MMDLSDGTFLATGDGDTSIVTSCAGQTVKSTITIGINGYSGPIQITKGGTYSGKWASTDPAVPAVLIRTDEPVILQNSSVTGPGDLIMAYGAANHALNLQVKNVVGNAQVPSVPGLKKGKFLWAEGAVSVDVSNCSMIGVSGGVLVAGGNLTHLSITKNVAEGMDDRTSDGHGGVTSTRATLGHFIQLINLIASNGAEIAWNQSINTPLQSSVEDIINIYGSKGASAALPIAIHDNYLQGAYSLIGSPYTGGGITVDSGGSGSPDSAFITITGNQIVSMQNGGLFIANGHDVIATKNRVVSSGQTSSGIWLADVYNDGFALEMQNFYSSPSFYNNSFTDNYAAMVRRNPQGQPIRADFLFPDISATSNNIVSGNIEMGPSADVTVVTAASEAQEYNSWLSKIKAGGMLLGGSQ